MEGSRVDYVLIFALEKELQAFLRILPEYETRQTDITFHKARVLGQNRRKPYSIVALRLPQMGNYEATAATTRAIDVWKPRHVLLGGIMGGVKRRGVKLGDLVVADMVIAHEPGKLRTTGLERRLQALRPATELLEVARSIEPRDWALAPSELRPDGAGDRIVPRIHFGAVVSGEKVIADASWMDALAADVHAEMGEAAKQLVGVEMEAYGAALACYRAVTAPGMLFAKAICDWADSNKNDDWQEYASAVSAAFLLSLISKSAFTPGTGHVPVRRDAKPYSSKSKIGLCRRMGDSWEDLADYYDIPLDERRTFRRGRQCQDVWAWLELRRKLDGLSDALDTIGRPDLQDELVPA